MESSRAREPRRTAVPHGSVLGFMVVGLVSSLSLVNHSDSVLPSGVYIAQPGWTPAKRILGD